jgi:hypothetical protein
LSVNFGAAAPGHCIIDENITFSLTMAKLSAQHPSSVSWVESAVRHIATTGSHGEVRRSISQAPPLPVAETVVILRSFENVKT